MGNVHIGTAYKSSIYSLFTIESDDTVILTPYSIAYAFKDNTYYNVSMLFTR